MATGIAGHNRGKKFVRGVGYVSHPEPEKPKVKERHCDKCGVVLVGTQFRPVHFLSDGHAYCWECFER